MKLLPILLLCACTSASANDWVLLRAPGETNAAQFHRTSVARTTGQASIWVRTLRAGAPGQAGNPEANLRMQVALIDLDCQRRTALLRGVGYISDDDEPISRHQLGPIASRDWIADPLRDSLLAIGCG